MYRHRGTQDLFEKLDGSSSLPGCDLAKMIRKHPLLVLLSVLCKSLQRSLIFIALPFSACALFGSGCKGTAFFNTLQMFRKKSLRKLAIFRIVLQNKGKKRVFLGKRQVKGDIQGARPPCHGGGLAGKTGPYRGKTMRWRGETRAGEQRKWARRTETRVSYDWEAIFSLLYI